MTNIPDSFVRKAISNPADAIQFILNRTRLGVLAQRIYFENIISKVDPWRIKSVDGNQFAFTTAANRTFHDWQDDFHSEIHVLNHFNEKIIPSDIFYDVGSNIGIYAVTAAASGAEVHAFEPHPEAASYLKLNLKKNGGGKVYKYALGSENKTTNLERNGFTGHKLSDEDDTGNLKVPVRRGDDVISEIEASPTVIKIDVEGAEMDVLKGLREALQDQVRIVYCELHPELSGGESDDIEAFLQRCGFHTKTIQERNSQTQIYATAR